MTSIENISEKDIHNIVRSNMPDEETPLEFIKRIFTAGYNYNTTNFSDDEIRDALIKAYEDGFNRNPFNSLTSLEYLKK